MSEIYKSCEFDNSYKISNYGNIKKVCYNGKERILKGSMLNRGTGYKYIQLQREGKRINYLIHRLVAIAFIPNDNKDYNVIDHIDQNSLNNNVSNLRWCNQKINSSNTKKYRNDILETDIRKRYNILKHQYERRDIENKKFYCSLCNTACRSNYELNKHNETKKHHQRSILE